MIDSERNFDPVPLGAAQALYYSGYTNIGDDVIMILLCVVLGTTKCWYLVLIKWFEFMFFTEWIQVCYLYTFALFSTKRYGSTLYVPRRIGVCLGRPPSAKKKTSSSSSSTSSSSSLSADHFINK